MNAGRGERQRRGGGERQRRGGRLREGDTRYRGDYEIKHESGISEGGKSIRARLKGAKIVEKEKGGGRERTEKNALRWDTKKKPYSEIPLSNTNSERGDSYQPPNSEPTAHSRAPTQAFQELLMHSAHTQCVYRPLCCRDSLV